MNTVLPISSFWKWSFLDSDSHSLPLNATRRFNGKRISDDLELIPFKYQLALRHQRFLFPLNSVDLEELCRLFTKLTDVFSKILYIANILYFCICKLSVSFFFSGPILQASHCFLSISNSQFSGFDDTSAHDEQLSSHGNLMSMVSCSVFIRIQWHTSSNFFIVQSTAVQQNFP